MTTALVLGVSTVLGPSSPTATQAEVGGPVGDEFTGTSLNTDVWELVDPVGDASLSVANGKLNLGVPSGVSHDAWETGIFSPRVVQQVANEDFEVEVRFDSAVSTMYQLQGLMAFENNEKLVRFDTYSDGSSQRLFAATFTDGHPAVRLGTAIPTTTPILMRLKRQGDAWTLRWSSDGTTWNVAATFDFNLTVSSLGVFVGNAGPNPAMTALIDYFRPVTDDGIAPTITDVSVDPASDAAVVTWTTDEPATSHVEFGTTNGYGLSAGDDALSADHQVTLSGLSCETEYHYRVASMDAAGNSTIGDDMTFTTLACTPGDTTGPVISNVGVNPGRDHAVVTWTTDEPATSSLGFGPTESLGQSAAGSGPTTEHAITASGLTCGTTYYYRPMSVDGAGNTTEGTLETFATLGCEAAVESDEFVGTTLDTSLWSIVDPVGDATAVVENNELSINVPDGVSHDFWMPIRSPRIMQDAPNTDIEVEAKFNSAVTARYQLQGLVAESLDGRFVRYDTYHDGSSQRLFAATFVNGTPAVLLNTSIPTSTPIYLRMARAGDTWTLRWSNDGTTWNVASSFTFSLTMSTIGLFAGNHDPNPAMTARVDYFRAVGQDSQPLTISNVAATPDVDSVVVGWTTNRPASSHVEYGPTTAYGQTAQDPALVTSHSMTVSGLACETTYHYRVMSVDSGGVSASSPDGTFTTAECSPTQGLVSDDFSGPALDANLWTVVDPLGHSQLTMTGTNAVVYIPGPENHDLWTANKNAVRLIQQAPDTDFEIEVKFDSATDFKVQQQGIIVQQDDTTFLRFGEHFDTGGRRLFAAAIAGSSATALLNIPLPASDGVYLRVRRDGDGWTLRYSLAGSTWVTAATFSHNMTVAGTGIFTGNVGGPAVAASVDYFSNLAAPVANDDGGAPEAVSTPPAFELWYGDTQDVGARGFGQQWLDIGGRVADSDGIGQLWYTLNESDPKLMTVGPDGKRLIGVGHFIADLDTSQLLSGPNQVVIHAFDRRGDRASHSVTVNNLNGPAPSLPDTVDWSAVDSIFDVAQVVDGRWEIQDNHVRVLETGYDRLISVGSRTWPDGYEVTVPITIHSASSTGVGLLTGWTGHAGTDQPRWEHPYGAVGWYDNNKLEILNTSASPVASTPRTLTPGVSYTFKLLAEPRGDGNSDYSFKVYETGSIEPQNWDVTAVLPSRAGSILLVAHHTDASFGTVSTISVGNSSP